MMIGLCIGVGGGYFVYGSYVWPRLKEWHLERIERQLEANFASHQKQFETFIEYAEALPELGLLEFEKDSLISFYVNDSLQSRGGSEPIFVSVGIDNFVCGDIPEEVAIIDNQLQCIIDGDTLHFKHWTLHFQGKDSDPLLPDLLAYEGIPLQEFLQLQQKIKALDCTAFEKGHDLIALRYRGHSLESLDYVIPLKDTPDRSKWTHLQGNFYWQHRREELFCGWMNWRRY